MRSTRTWTPDLDEVSVAVHEAGHAVVAILNGFAVHYATLASRDGGAGVVIRPRKRGFPALEAIAVSCAGMIAEDVAGTSHRWDIVEMSDDPAEGDITQIRTSARAWHAASEGVTVLDLINRSWSLAFGLVVDHFSEVIAVAKGMLASNRALTGPEIRQLMNTAPTVQPDPIPEDGATFWVPTYSRLRNWGPAASSKRKAAA